MISLADYSNYQDRLYAAQFWLLQCSSCLFLYQLHLRFVGRTSTTLVPSIHWWVCCSSRLTGCSRHPQLHSPDPTKASTARWSESRPTALPASSGSASGSPPTWKHMWRSSWPERCQMSLQAWSEAPAGPDACEASDLLWLWPLTSGFCGLTSCNCAHDVNNLWILVWQTWRF